MGFSAAIIAALVTLFGDNDKLFDIAQTVFMVGGVTLAIAFLVLKVKDRQRSEQELYLSAKELHLKEEAARDRKFNATVEQLGHESSEVRIIGVQTLAELADGHNKQRVVAAFCGYLRTNRQELEVQDFLGEKHFKDAAVEATILDLIRKHLCDGSWSECDFDLQGAKFRGKVDLRNCAFAGVVNFAGATFEAPIRLADSVFDNAVNFENATFSESADFTGVVFNDAALFSGAVFHEKADFAQAAFTEKAKFEQTSFWGESSFVGVSNPPSL